MNPGDIKHTGWHCVYWLDGDTYLRFTAYVTQEDSTIKYHTEGFPKWFM